MPSFVTSDSIRSQFASAMSVMYRDEVPAYGTLADLVSQVNDEVLEDIPALKTSLELTGELSRISEERHGAIRLGTPEELSMMRRAFAVMGMHPVGYYDLTVAGIPVHSTAFRPIDDDALAANPFRVFCSLLRLDLIEDVDLRDTAASILSKRQIFSDRAVTLIEKVEAEGGLRDDDAYEFVKEITTTFRWRSEALVDADTYERLHAAHRLVADIVSFKGPHINHLTPRSLDIDIVQARMTEAGLNPKAIVEGPDRRKCPILLRQTAFKALDEQVAFVSAAGDQPGQHTARFGEVEQRGCALTPKGRDLYDALLTKTREHVTPAADGSNAADYMAALENVFAAFPDDWDTLRRQSLAYFNFVLTEKGRDVAGKEGLTHDIEELIASNYISAEPLTYEDFLPVSAAGIFQSNLGDDATQAFSADANQTAFEDALGAKVKDPFLLYEDAEAASLAACMELLVEH